MTKFLKSYSNPNTTHVSNNSAICILNWYNVSLGNRLELRQRNCLPQRSTDNFAELGRSRERARRYSWLRSHPISIPCILNASCPTSVVYGPSAEPIHRFSPSQAVRSRPVISDAPSMLRCCTLLAFMFNFSFRGEFGKSLSLIIPATSMWKSSRITEQCCRI